MNEQRLPRQLRDATRLQQQLKTRPEHYWRRKGEKMALDLFHEMARRVPAYKDFLDKNDCKPKQIQNIKDFTQVPIIDKDNYLRQYPREDLCWDGKFADKSWVISTTSGSTGLPFYFPRQNLHDKHYALTAELYLRENFQIQSKSTLYIDAFAMGAWIGGLFTYEAIKEVASKGYKLSIITPGINKAEIISAIKNLAGSFDQIIIGAYAPFLKDTLDDGAREGIVWKDLDIGFVFSAEAFSENFRNYIFETTNPTDPLRSTLNHYGTVDLGTMAHETVESILLRRTLVREGSLKKLFPESRRQPTLCQYNPMQFYFESVTDNLICSANSGIPLVRYNLHDYGGVLPKNTAHKKLLEQGVDIEEAVNKAGIRSSVWNLPYVYVYERNDFSVSYYGFTVYPDMIRRSIQEKDFIDALTGKFSMSVNYDVKGRQKLTIHIEMKPDIILSTSQENSIQSHLHNSLLHESSEYKEASKMIGDEMRPTIKLWPYEDNTHFKSGAKQKWVIK